MINTDHVRADGVRADGVRPHNAPRPPCANNNAAYGLGGSPERDCLFGEVVNGAVRLNPLGQIVYDEWLRSMGIRREIRLYEDEFVVMPNHLHGIVWIVGADAVRPNGTRPDGVRADGVRPDGTRPDDIPHGMDRAPKEWR
jgi:hypothetical protein